MKIFHFWCIIEHIRAQYERQITEEKLERVEKKKIDFRKEILVSFPAFPILGRFIGWRVGQVNSRKHDAPWRRFYGGGQRRGAGVSAINTSRRYPRDLHNLSLPSTPLFPHPADQFVRFSNLSETFRRLDRAGLQGISNFYGIFLWIVLCQLVNRGNSFSAAPR